ncbi:MAG TPA: TolC family protein [Thermoanaerobaculia bacterium]|nr:TolC family protein [Thermoanaerobaculia bacterium]
MLNSVRVVMALGLLASPVGALAQEQPKTPAATQTMPVPEARDDNENPRALRLSLDDAIKGTVENNLGIRLQRYDYRMSGWTARSQFGRFDLFTFGTLSTGDRQPAAEGAPNIGDLTANLGVRQFLSTGGSYQLSFNNNETTVLEPAYSSNLSFGLNQPLLRDFGVDVNRRFVNIARNNLGISEGAFENALLLGVLGAEQAYYDLIYARQNYDVRRQSLILARDQERITQIRIDVGASAPLDILEPRVAIATREEEVIAAEASIRDAEDRLRRLMNLPASEWDRPIIPTDAISYTPVTVDLEASVARAFQLRPEIKQAGLGVENDEIELLYARNQVLPELDFNINYGLAGLGGAQIIRDPLTNEPIGIIGGAFSDAINQVFGFDYPNWTTSFTVGVPIRNIGARAERRRAELNLERSVQDKTDIEQAVAIQVRQAARDIQTGSRQIAASSAAREAAEQNLEAERRRFENGMSTNFDVLRVQQALSDARSREILAVVAYNKAVATYHRAVGDLLQVRGIAVNERIPEEFDMPRSPLEKIDWLNYRNWAD